MTRAEKQLDTALATPLTSQQPLVVQQLCKNFGRHQVLQGLDFSIAPGAIQGLVGLNGAGKTTTLSCVLGLQAYDSGVVSVFGLAPHQLHRARGKVAVVFDEPCLNPQLTVWQLLQLARLTTGSKQSDAQLCELMALLGVTRYRDFKLHTLSLGNRRRASIAQALVGAPHFIVLDEPFNGLDAGGVDDLLVLVKKLNLERGITFLLASHQLSYLEKICTHMAFLHQGKMLLNDSIANLLRADTTQVEIYTQQIEQTQALLSTLVGVTLVSTVSANTVSANTVSANTVSANTTGIGRSAPTDVVSCQLQGIGVAELNRHLVQHDIAVNGLVPQRHSLEDLFREVTKDA